MNIDDLEADIKAAIKGAPAEEVSEPIEAPVEQVEAPQTEETGETPEHKLDATGRAHAKDGKFAPKTKDEPAEQQEKPKTEAKAQEPATDKAETTDKQKSEKPLLPPSHWKPEAKAAFLNAPREIQQQILDREADMEKGRSEWATKAEDYNKLNKVLSPHIDRWARSGMEPAMAVNQLLAVEAAIQSNPVTGIANVLRAFHPGNELRVIAEIARQNGYALTQANNQEEAAQGNMPSQADPTARRLEETIQQTVQKLLAPIEQKFQSFETGQQKTRSEAIQSEIDAVRNDPKNLYYENLKEEIAALISIGDRKGDSRPIRERLQAAYDQAAWANPTTRSLIMQADQKAKEEATRKAEAEKARAARAASGSITGSPGTIATGARQQPEPPGKPRLDDIERDVRAAMGGGRA